MVGKGELIKRKKKEKKRKRKAVHSNISGDKKLITNIYSYEKITIGVFVYVYEIVFL